MITLIETKTEYTIILTEQEKELLNRILSKGNWDNDMYSFANYMLQELNPPTTK